MIISKITTGIVPIIKKVIFILLIIALSGCAVVSPKKNITERKKGFMLLENTSQAYNKKYKKTRYAKKLERHRQRGRR